MSSSNSTSTKQTNQSSGSEKTPDSGTSRTRRAYTKSSYSPSLRAFDTFEESLARFVIHVQTKIDQIGAESVDLLRTELERMHIKCESMQDYFKDFISLLDDAIVKYEKTKPTDLAPNANSVISPEQKEVNHSSSFKDNDTIDTIYNALNLSIATIDMAIKKKINKSIYNDQYSISLEKKLKKLKKMCEAAIQYVEQTRKRIKDAIEKNEKIRGSHDF